VKWTRKSALAVLALLAVCAVGLPSCGPGSTADREVIIPEIGIRLTEGQSFAAPCDGWFLSDAELKRLFMSEYEETFQ